MPIAKSVHGIQLSYEVTGDGPLVVVFQHGWGSTVRHYDAILKHLPVEGRKFITVDLAGHGASTNHDDAHGVAAYAQQLIDVVNDAGCDKFVTVGHSMGAKFNQYLRLIAPDRLLGQVSLAPSPAGFALEEATDEAINYLASNSGNPAGFEGVLRSLITEPVPEDFIKSWAAEAARIPSSILAASMHCIGHTDFEGDLAKSGAVVPTLVLAGKRDPIYHMDKVAERIPREAPHAVLRFMESGHDIPNERPLETSLIVDGFLSAIQSGLAAKA
ncbi:alpha/beta hydrolase [Phyllobacterium sp. YR531]|uniref:alpha/beta fold hydrolase n=1 Tax=Phyllobacterium sp. YR531 TaxID=1144343 RepID=UPI00026FBA75|nr:alpha/beta hydrolase [Phyllobacterium sp. YR531]EJN05839.1 putative hydrolase or acyltransferase of alpha/beta superfamily [Phyllobacterium sp. YR531]